MVQPALWVWPTWWTCGYTWMPKSPVWGVVQISHQPPWYDAKCILYTCCTIVVCYVWGKIDMPSTAKSSLCATVQMLYNLATYLWVTSLQKARVLMKVAYFASWCNNLRVFKMCWGGQVHVTCSPSPYQQTTPPKHMQHAPSHTIL